MNPSTQIVVRRIPSFHHLSNTYYVLIDGQEVGALNPELDPLELTVEVAPGTHTLELELRFLGLSLPGSDPLELTLAEGTTTTIQASAFAQGATWLKVPFFPSLWAKLPIVLRPVTAS